MEEPLSAPTPHPSRLPPDSAGFEAIIDAHAAAVAAQDDGYVDPVSGLFVFTSEFHRRRGHCCDSGCRHCPYL